MRKFFLDTAGTALTEFAFAAPLLLVLAIGVADYGILMTDSTVLEASLRSVAEMVKATPTIAASSIPTSLLPSGVGAPTINSVQCWCPNVAPSGSPVTCPSSGASSPCTTTTNYYTGVTTDTRIIHRVSISATESFSPMIPWSHLIFPTSLNPTADIRTQ
jgi:Flp pilus assembly protein TadG